MILPLEFKDFSEYFSELCLFMQKHTWLYEGPVTHILVNDILAKVPEDWVEHLLCLTHAELNDVPKGYIKDDWPTSLKQFSRNCRRLTLPVLNSNVPQYETFNLDDWLLQVPRDLWKGMSPKKKEEVGIMSALVHQECKQLGINKILDLGSGLGYIDRLLLLKGYKIIGIESESKLITFASTQKDNFFPSRIANNLFYEHLRISMTLLPEVRDLILNRLLKTTRTNVQISEDTCKKSKENNKYHRDKLALFCEAVSLKEDLNQVCMIGLHACGDLAVTGIKMYLSFPEVSALVLVPCCYHKMCLKKERVGVENKESCNIYREISEEIFENFPLSKTLLKESNGTNFTQRSFLRLASQGSNNSWQDWTEADHQQHAFNVLSRAVVELYTQQEGASLKKCFRRVVNKSSLKEQNFSYYIDESLSRNKVIKNTTLLDENQDTTKNKLLTEWEKYKEKLPVVEVLTALQMCLEPVAESLIIADRANFLWEEGVQDVRLVRMMDSHLSPRCIAYICTKR